MPARRAASSGPSSRRVRSPWWIKGQEFVSLAALARGQPAGAGLAELLHRHALIASAIFGQGVTPAAVDTLMDEGLSAAVPECATERRPSSRPGGCASRSRRWATKSRCRLHGTHEPEGRCPRVGKRRSSPISRSLSAGRPGGPGPPGGGVVAGSFSSSGTALNANRRGKARQAEQLGPAIEQSPGRLTDMIEKRQWSSPMALGASRYSIQPSCFWKPRPS
jgi:hypothetical protein